MAKRVLVSLVLLGALSAAGCPHDQYVIEMVPRRLELERTVTVSGVDGPTTAPASQPERKVSLVRGRWASEVGGAGHYHRLATQMGSVLAYLERFRGNDDQAAVLEQQFRSADQLVDLLLAWAKARHGQRKGADKLLAFLDKDFRRDLKNLAAYSWLFSAAARQVGPDGATEPANARIEAIARFAQYALEREYLNPGDAAKFIALVREGDDRARLEAVRMLARDFLARRAGQVGQLFLDDLMKLLSGDAQAEEQFAEFVTQWQPFKQELARFKQRQATQPDLKESEPTPVEWVGDLAESVVNIDTDLFNSDDEVEISLKTGAEPILTTGRWDEKSGTVAWSLRVPDESKDRPMPVMAVAVWAEPDEKFQQDHLGRAALAGRRLAEYCLWRNGLSGEDARVWDAFVAGLRPGDGLRGRLKGFRFEPPPATQDEDEKQPVRGAEILLDSLQSEQGE